MRRNYAEVTIQFSSLTVKHTNIYPKYEIFSASSAMGGLLGLLLGGSMMTVYEIAEFPALFINSCQKYRKNEDRANIMNPNDARSCSFYQLRACNLYMFVRTALYGFVNSAQSNF